MIHTLEVRREALVARSVMQRERLLARLAPAARKLAAADRVVATLRAHPVVTAVAVSGVALLGPGALLRWALRLAPLYALFART